MFELVEPEEFCIYMSSPWEKFKPGNWRQGWIQHDLVGVGGGGGGRVLCQLWCRVVSVTCATLPSTYSSTCFTTVVEL